MNSTAATIMAWTPADPPERRHRRVALGIAVSLALHLMLLAAWRGQLFRARSEPQAAPPRSIAVWLRPPAPKPAPPPQAHAPGRAAPTTRPRRVVAVPRRDQEPPGKQLVQQAEQEAAPVQDASPAFDHDAALRMARRIASEPDPSGAPRQPLQTESRLARGIAAAKRRDCKDGLPGGLLGPLIILLDKKDSGCKW